MDEIHISSPAKINLFLEVIARRPDGYHEIETVMQVVDLCDDVRLSRIPRGIEVSVSGEEVPAGPENLAYRAAALLVESAGLRGGVHIGLEKRIPVSGGLGGGSSNAAAVLAGLNRLYGLRCSREELQELAAKLDELERKVSSHDQAIGGLINAIRQLMRTPEPTGRPIGFTADIGKKRKG